MDEKRIETRKILGWILLALAVVQMFLGSWGGACISLAVGLNQVAPSDNRSRLLTVIIWLLLALAVILLILQL